MPNQRRGKTSKSIARMIKDGYGQGELDHYKPWLDIRTVPSHGYAHRVYGKTTKRTHELLSNGEKKCLSIFDWSPKVIDIQEQYPLLPLEETIGIAEQLGYKHPTHPDTQQEIVMTSDFRLTVHENNQTVIKVRTYKETDILNTKPERILEKFEIEKVYWENRNIDWAIITEREIPEGLAVNTCLFLDQKPLRDYGLSPVDVRDISQYLTNQIQNTNAALNRLALDTDRALGFKLGTSLRVAYHLLETRQWVIDFHQAIDTEQVLQVLEVKLVDAEA